MPRVPAMAGRLTDPQGWLQDLQVLDADHERELSGEYSLAGGSRSFTRYVAPVRDPHGEWIGRLALCRELEAHGGRIGFESEPGRGSTFWFTLAASRAQSTVRF